MRIEFTDHAKEGRPPELCASGEYGTGRSWSASLWYYPELNVDESRDAGYLGLSEPFFHGWVLKLNIDGQQGEYTWSDKDYGFDQAAAIKEATAKTEKDVAYQERVQRAKRISRRLATVPPIPPYEQK